MVPNSPKHIKWKMSFGPPEALKTRPRSIAPPVKPVNNQLILYSLHPTCFYWFLPIATFSYWICKTKIMYYSEYCEHGDHECPKVAKIAILGSWSFMATIKLPFMMVMWYIRPLKKDQKCSTEQKSRGQNVDPIKSYGQNTDFCHFSLFLAPFYSVKTVKLWGLRGGYKWTFLDFFLLLMFLYYVPPWKNNWRRFEKQLLYFSTHPIIYVYLSMWHLAAPVHRFLKVHLVSARCAGAQTGLLYWDASYCFHRFFNMCENFSLFTIPQFIWKTW